MDRNSHVTVTAKPRCRVTEHELFTAKVKLAGLMVLAVVDLLVIACTKWPP